MTIERQMTQPGSGVCLLEQPEQPAVEAARTADRPALAAAQALFADLNADGVRYCHWKSNIRLAEALSGRTDLDLLVDPGHAERFKALLDRHQVKRAFAAPGKRYPGIENYLGFDPDSGGQYHLHVHYELVLGEQFVKNYHLPLEKAFLDSAFAFQGVMVPAPTLELAVFSMRALLKYRDRDALKDALKIRRPGLPLAILAEVGYLQAQVSPAEMAQTLDELSGVLPVETIRSFLDTVASEPRNGRRLHQLRRDVRRGLRRYQRHGRLRASVAYFGEMWRRRTRFRFSPADNKMTPAGGGITVALIGADGSGKSTMSKELLKWLGWKLSARRYYLGSKEPSRRSRGLYILFRMARRSHRSAGRRFGQHSAPARLLGRVRSWLYDAHSLALGQDRRRQSRDGQRAAAAGSVVLFDRFPLRAPLDGPRIQLSNNGHSDALQRAMARSEAGVYGAIESPDWFLVLQVRSEVSLTRKPDHQAQAIEAKCQAVDQLLDGQFSDRCHRSNTVAIDAEQPFEQVELALKRALWSIL